MPAASWLVSLIGLDCCPRHRFTYVPQALKTLYKINIENPIEAETAQIEQEHKNKSNQLDQSFYEMVFLKHLHSADLPFFIMSHVERFLEQAYDFWNKISDILLMVCL